MIKSLQETREHIRKTKDSSLGEEKVKRYRVDTLLDFLGWPIRSEAEGVGIDFNSEVDGEVYDYVVKNDSDFEILVDVMDSDSFEDYDSQDYHTENIERSLLLVITDGVEYNVIFFNGSEAFEILSCNILQDGSRWFLNFIGYESVRNNQIQEYSERLGSIEEDRKEIRRIIDQSHQNLRSTRLPNESLEDLQNRLESRLDDEVKLTKEKFSDVSYGASEGYELEEVVSGLTDIILVVNKGGLGIEDYVGVGGTWCSAKFGDIEPSHLALKDPDSNDIRYILDVDQILDRGEFEDTENVELSDKSWYEDGEKLIRVSQLYALNDCYKLSEEHSLSELPVMIKSSDMVESDVKF